MLFLKRLGVGVGIVTALTAVTGIGGIFFAPLGMLSLLIGGIATFGLVFAGRIWGVVITFQENVGLGVLTLFLPLFWTHKPGKRIGRSQLAFALMASGLIPGVIGIVAVSFSPAMQSSADRLVATRAKNAKKMIKVIHRRESNYPPTGELREAAFSWIGNLKEPAQFISEGDRSLSQFRGYVKGSLAVDESQRKITFQHRGADALEQHYKFYLTCETGIYLNPLITTKQTP